MDSADRIWGNEERKPGQELKYLSLFYPVIRGCHSGKFLKLPHEMQIALITAETGKAADAHIAVSQIIFCQLQTGVYDVLLAGDTEKLFIEMLEMGNA